MATMAVPQRKKGAIKSTGLQTGLGREFTGIAYQIGVVQAYFLKCNIFVIYEPQGAIWKLVKAAIAIPICSRFKSNYE